MKFRKQALTLFTLLFLLALASGSVLAQDTAAASDNSSGPALGLLALGLLVVVGLTLQFRSRDNPQDPNDD